MSLQKLESVVSRVFFFGAFVLLLLALLERVANYYGYTVLQMPLKAVTVLETSVVLLVFVIVILLREIREALTRKP